MSIENKAKALVAEAIGVPVATEHDWSEIWCGYCKDKTGESVSDWGSAFMLLSRAEYRTCQECGQTSHMLPEDWDDAI